VRVHSEPSPWNVLGDLDEFGIGYWDTAPIHRRGAPNFDPASVITLRELDRLVASRHANIRLLEGGGYVDDGVHRERGLRRSDERTWLSDPAALVARFRAGATMVMPSAHEVWAPIARLTSELARLLAAQVGAALFVSPPDSVTDWHADGGHLFVLHLYGSKLWLLDSADTEAHAATTHPPAVAVRPGDVLYVPKGFLHRVQGGEGPAVHLSCYSSGATYGDLLKSALANRIDDLTAASGRNPLNPNWGDQSRAVWTATLLELLDALHHEISDMRQAVPALDADSLAPARVRPPIAGASHECEFLEAYEAFARSAGN
jgi:JmjC domain